MTSEQEIGKKVDLITPQGNNQILNVEHFTGQINWFLQQINYFLKSGI